MQTNYKQSNLKGRQLSMYESQLSLHTHLVSQHVRQTMPSDQTSQNVFVYVVFKFCYISILLVISNYGTSYNII